MFYAVQTTDHLTNSWTTIRVGLFPSPLDPESQSTVPLDAEYESKILTFDVNDPARFCRIKASELVPD